MCDVCLILIIHLVENVNFKIQIKVNVPTIIILIICQYNHSCNRVIKISKAIVDI